MRILTVYFLIQLSYLELYEITVFVGQKQVNIGNFSWFNIIVDENLEIS